MDREHNPDLHGSNRSSLSNVNVFADDFEVDDGDSMLGAVQHQDTSSAESGDGHRHTASSTVRRSTSLTVPAETRQYAPGPRNSIMKGYSPLSHLPSRGDATASSGPARNSSIHSGTTVFTPSVRRSTSSTSSFIIARSQSPFAGASGPSHPYTMYPQGTGVSRSVSTRTSSTIRAPPRSISDASGPAHPYGMYPQNVFADPEDESLVDVQAAIPVGFPGRHQVYHRRIGADGEEQDIVGPDGHAEQLPPYTLYPEDAPRRPPQALAAGSMTAVAALMIEAPSNDSLLSRSNSTASPVQTNISSQMSPFDDSQTLVPEREICEKRSLIRQPWNEVKKRRFCGGRVPFWAVLLLVGVCGLVIGGVAAAVAGILTEQHNHHHHGSGPPFPHPTPSSSPALTDASPIPMSTSIAPLPVGQYLLPLIANFTPDSCLVLQNQSSAWACSIPPSGQSNLSVNISQANGAYEYYTASINAPVTPSEGIQWYYGAQSPTFSVLPQNLSLVEEVNNPGNGPAWYFQTVYDKIVVLNETEFSEMESNTKRTADWHFSPSKASTELEPVAVGETAWFCFWNSTAIEVFIYDNPNISSTSSSITTATSTPPQATSSASVISSTYSGLSSTVGLTSPFTANIASSTPSSVASTTSPATSSNTGTVQGASIPADYEAMMSYKAAAYGSSPPYAGARLMERQEASSSATSLQNGDYPRQIKIVEKRLPGNNWPNPPYCQLMTVLPGGDIQSAPNPNQSANPVEFTLQEFDAQYQPPEQLGKRQTSQFGGEEPAGICGCVWLSTIGD